MGNGIEFGSVNVRMIRVATRISIDCDCSGHFFASVMIMNHLLTVS